MTRHEHILTILNDIATEANFTVLDKYEEADQTATDNTFYAFIVNESEEAQFEDAGCFQVTSLVLAYIDFQIDDFGDSFTLLKNQIIQDLENARITADLTLNRTEGSFNWSTTVPMMRSISGTIDSNNKKGIVDVLFEMKTLARPI